MDKPTLVPSLWPELSRREREVAACFIAAYTTIGTAMELGITARTAEAHRESILQKLGRINRVQLVHMYYERELNVYISKMQSPWTSTAATALPL
jgi:DNA-binding CsgD family transcriptional regulator